MVVPQGHSKEKDVNVFFEATRPKISDKLSSDLREFQRYKFMITLRIQLYKEKPDGSIDYAEPRFHHRNQLLLLEIDDIEDRLNIAFAQIQEALEKWTSNGSGWIVDRV